jgi:hypothetical protein
MPRKFSLVFIVLLLFPASISLGPTSFLFLLQYRKRCCDYFYYFHVAILVSVGVFVLFQCCGLRIKEFFFPRSNEAKDKRGEILGFVISFLRQRRFRFFKYLLFYSACSSSGEKLKCFLLLEYAHPTFFLLLFLRLCAWMHQWHPLISPIYEA